MKIFFGFSLATLMEDPLGIEMDGIETDDRVKEEEEEYQEVEAAAEVSELTEVAVV